jgi:hypothetical protein
MNANATTQPPPPIPKLRPCPDCRHQVSYRAEACPQCGCNITAVDRQTVRELVKEIRPAIKKEKEKSDAMAMMAGAVFVIAGFVFLWFYFPSDAQSTTTNRMPWYMGQQFVKEKLAPRKASFPIPDDQNAKQEQLEDGSYVVIGYVDTVNDFNAPVRKHWSATVKENPGGDTWTCKRVEIW